jgi:pyridoxal biosynthesis lyase PdxS
VKQKGTEKVKRGLAQMLKGGVIMDVTTPEQAIIAQEAGAVAVMALERVPADIRKEGGVARMAAIEVVQRIMDAVTIPVMAKARIGHFVEAQVLESTSSTKAKSSRPPTSPIISTSGPSPCPSCAARATWAKRCAGSRKAPR